MKSRLLSSMVVAAVLCAPATAYAIEVQLPRASQQRTDSPGTLNSWFSLDESDRTVTHAFGALTVTLPTWRSGGQTDPQTLTASSGGIHLTREPKAAMSVVYNTPDRTRDNGAIIVSGTRQQTVVGHWGRWSQGWGNTNDWVGLNVWETSTTLEQFTLFSTGNTAGIKRWRVGSLATRHWGDSVTPGARMPEGGWASPSFSWLTVMSWMRSGANVTIRTTTLQVGQGAGHGAASRTTEQTMTWTTFQSQAHLQQIQQQNSSQVLWFEISGTTVRRPTDPEAPGSYYAIENGVWAAGSTNETTAVSAIHGGAHAIAAWTIPPVGRNIIDLATFDAPSPSPSPLDGVEFWSEETSQVASFKDVEDSGKFGEWLAEQMTRLIGPIGRLLDDVFWWLNSFDRWIE